MILVYALLFLAASAPMTLEKLKADSNPEHRAKAAVEFALSAERAAEQASDHGDDAALKTDIGDMLAAMELARDSFAAAGKTAARNPTLFKSSELRSHEILHRLADLRQKLDADQQSLLDGPIMKIQAIHDVWFDGIMGRMK